jgi:hypothetical protein
MNLTSEALYGFDKFMRGEIVDLGISSSPVCLARRLGAWLAQNGYPRPQKVETSRGYTLRVNRIRNLPGALFDVSTTEPKPINHASL